MKRAAQAVHDLAAQLVSMTPAQLKRAGIDSELREEIDRVRGMTSHGAHKRELGHLAKLLRALDEDQRETLNAAIGSRRDQHRQITAAQRRAELLRERLLNGGDAELGLLLDRHPDLDRQHLRNLLRQAHSAKTDQRRARAARELLQQLQDLPDEQAGIA